MKHHARLPRTDELEALLGQALTEGLWPVTVIERKANLYESTFRSEEVTCRIEAGVTDGHAAAPVVRLFGKYAGPGRPATGRGLAFEAYAHRAVAAPSGLTVARRLAAHHDDVDGGEWLIYEFVDGLRINQTPWPQCLEAAATWIGQFHARWEGSLADPALSGLPRFDEMYYGAALDRAFRRLELRRPRFPEAAGWILDRREIITQLIKGRLLSGPQTVIHGEFYPGNIILAEGRVCPVDWESAAVAAGAIDIAMLTARWGSESVDLATSAYAAARNGTADPELNDRIAAARLFTELNHPDDRPTQGAAQPRYLTEARAAAATLGLD